MSGSDMLDRACRLELHSTILLLCARHPQFDLLSHRLPPKNTTQHALDPNLDLELATTHFKSQLTSPHHHHSITLHHTLPHPRVLRLALQHTGSSLSAQK